MSEGTVLLCRPPRAFTLALDPPREQSRSRHRVLDQRGHLWPLALWTTPVLYMLQPLAIVTSLCKRPPGSKNMLIFSLWNKTACRESRENQAFKTQLKLTWFLLVRLVFSQLFWLWRFSGWTSPRRDGCVMNVWAVTLRSFSGAKNPAAFVSAFLSRWHKQIFIYFCWGLFYMTAPESPSRRSCRTDHVCCTGAYFLLLFPQLHDDAEVQRPGKEVDCVFVLCCKNYNYKKKWSKKAQALVTILFWHLVTLWLRKKLNCILCESIQNRILILVYTV